MCESVHLSVCPSKHQQIVKMCITLEPYSSIELVETPILQVSQAKICSYIMIVDSNMIVWTPLLEYLIFLSLPNLKLFSTRYKSRANIHPQLQFISDARPLFSLGAVRTVQADFNFKNSVSKIYVHHMSCTLRSVDSIGGPTVMTVATCMN